MEPEATGMARLHDIKRHLLRAAVHENAGTRPPPIPQCLPGWRRSGRSWEQRLLLVVLPVVLLTLSYVLAMVPEERRGLLYLTTLVTSRPAGSQDSTWSPPLPAPAPVDLRVFPLRVKRIALDPGHGGVDAGAVTPFGSVVEKDVTLDIGQRLRRLLERAAFEVLMTRGVDETVPLTQRVALANTAGADLFVSIHVNSFATSQVRGAEVYYLGPTSDPQTLQLTAVENRHSGYSLGDYRRLLERVYLDVRRTESYHLANAVQQELTKLLRRVDMASAIRNVKTAPFLVLVATMMPAILAEVAYLSNEEEARLLATPEYRQRLAQALFQGIRTYTDTLNTHATKKGS